MCKILNKHAVGTPAGAVYVGRGGKWGRSRSGSMAIALRSSPITKRGCEIGTTRNAAREERIVCGAKRHSVFALGILPRSPVYAPLTCHGTARRLGVPIRQSAIA